MRKLASQSLWFDDHSEACSSVSEAVSTLQGCGASRRIPALEMSMSRRDSWLLMCSATLAMPSLEERSPAKLDGGMSVRIVDSSLRGGQGLPYGASSRCFAQVIELCDAIIDRVRGKPADVNFDSVADETLWFFKSVPQHAWPQRSHALSHLTYHETDARAAASNESDAAADTKQ